MNRDRIFGLVAALALAAGIGVIFWANDAFYREVAAHADYMNTLAIPRAPEYGVARIVLDFGNGSYRIFEGTLDPAAPPYSLARSLDEIAAKTGLAIRVDGGALASVDGIGMGGAWMVYRNGLRMDAELERIIVSGGDRFRIQFELTPR